MMPVEIIVPVAPDEPAEIINNSIDSLKSLERPDDLEYNFRYVIDSEDLEADSRKDALNVEGVDLIWREPDDGSKAGAINKVLRSVEGPEYISIFDVDARPDKDFLLRCKEDLESNREVFISSSPRRILNGDRNAVTELVEAEFQFFNDIQYLNDRSGSFNLFNGPMGLIDGEVAKELMFDESPICEDTDFTVRGFIRGKRVSLTRETSLGERAPTNFRDLRLQKLRWIDGARESLQRNLSGMLAADIPFRIKSGWFFSMTLPFVAFLASPLAFLYSVRFAIAGDNVLRATRKGIFLFLYAWLVAFLGLVSIKKSLMGEDIEWVSPDRD